MKRATLALLVVAMFLPQAAATKEISKLRVCGAAGCTNVVVPEGLHEFPGMGERSAPPPAGPFVEIELALEHGDRLWYVPGVEWFAFDSEIADAVQWSHAGEQEIDRLIAAAARRVVPHRPRAVAALVGDRPVEGDVSGYLALFGVTSPGSARVEDDSFEQVSVETDPPSPWALTPLWFHSGQGLLQRGGKLIRLRQDVADDLRAARSIGATRGRDFDWPLVTGSLLAAAALGLTTVLLARRSRAPRPGTV